MTAPNWGGLVQGAAAGIFGQAVAGGQNWLTQQLFGSRAGPTQIPFDRPGVQVGGYQVNPAGILPGGAPFIQRLATGSVAVSPAIVTKQRRVCPRGFVLAIDGNCYPKAMVPRKFRAWKPDPRPVFSRRDAAAVNRAATVKHRLVELTKRAGAHASVNRPTRKATARMIYPQHRPPGTSIVNVD